MNDDSIDSDETPEQIDELLEENESAGEQVEALNLSVDERKLVTQPYDLGVKSISNDIDLSCTGLVSRGVDGR